MKRKINIKKVSGVVTIIAVIICLGFASVFGFQILKNTILDTYISL